MADDEVLSFRVPTELKASLQRLAEAEKRKLSTYIRLLLEEHVAQAKKQGGRKI